MAFSSERLSVVAYADGFTLWHYRGQPDSQATIGAAGYFTPVAHMVRQGDMVIASGADAVLLLVLSGAGAALRASAI